MSDVLLAIAIENYRRVGAAEKHLDACRAQLHASVARLTSEQLHEYARVTEASRNNI